MPPKPRKKVSREVDKKKVEKLYGYYTTEKAYLGPCGV